MPSRKKKLQRKLNRRDSSTGSSSLQTCIESSSKPAVMSSFSYQMSERLECSICLEVFSDPVSTPCGHNFCKICLSTCWNSSQDCRCPNCKETFNQRPDLKINTTLRDVVDEHKKKSHEKQADAEVVCDICTEGKLKAVKSCLVCQSSFCETHLEPHLRVSGLKKHKLIDPVKNLQDYIRQKHERPLELFCRDDQTHVCLSCTEGEHKFHNTVPIRESELQEMMEERPRGAETHDERVIKYLEQEISEMKKRNIKLLTIAEKHRAAETQHECLIKDLKKEITEIQLRNNEMEMVKQKQKIAENVLKLRDQEIIELKKTDAELKMRDAELKKRGAELKMVKQRQRAAENFIKDRDQEIIELKKTDAELKMRDAELKKRDAELKKTDAELEKRDAELEMVKQKQRTAENFIKVRDQEITQLKKRDSELVMVLMKQKTAERQYENTIRDRDQEVTQLKKRDAELKMRESELKKRDAELVMVKQKQRAAENGITVLDQEIRHRDQEITELKMRDAEQQQKISSTENNLLLLQEQHQEHLSLQKKSSSEDLCSRIVGIVLLVLLIIACARLEFLQKEITELQKRNSDLETDKAARVVSLQKEITELQKRNSDLETDKAELRMKWTQQFPGTVLRSGCSSFQSSALFTLFTLILQYFTII